MTNGRAQALNEHQKPMARRRPSRQGRLLLAGAAAFFLMGANSADSIAAGPADSDLYEQAIVAAQDRNYADARTHLEDLLDSDPSHLPARILLGEVLLALGDAQESEAQLLQALNAGGDPSLIVVPLGQAELLQGKTAELLNDVQIQTDDPMLKADVSNLRGYALLERGRMTEAKAAFGEAAAVMTDNPTPLVGLARIALVENDPVTAADYAEQAFATGANGAVWRLRGDIAAYNGDDETAIAAYGHAIDLAWGDVEARTARASLLIRSGRLNAAMEDLSAVREIVPSDLEAVYLTAIVLAREGRAEDATALLTSAKRDLERILPTAMENNRTTIRMAGLICYALGDFSEASRYFEQLVAISPTDDSALALLARSRIQLGEYATAIRDLQTALTIDDENPETQGLLGLVYMLRGELDEAQAHLSRAAASGQVPGSLLRQGIGFLRMHQPDAAMEAFARARGHGSTDLAASLLTAIGAMAQHDFPAAVQWSRRAVDLAPDSTYVRHIAALALINDGQEAQARAELDAALKRDRDFVPARLELARLDASKGDIKAAKAAYKAVLDLDRGNAAAMLELADLERLDNQPQRAEELLQTARDENPTVEGVWTHSVEFYAAQGDMEKVQELGREFVQRNPDAIAIRNLIAVLLWRANHLEEAVSEYRDLMSVSLDRGAILYRIGLVQEDMKAYADATDSFRRALGWLPDNNVIWRKTILLEAQGGDVEAAMRLLDEYRARKTARDVQTLTGQLYLAAGNFQASLNAFRAAQQSDSDPAAIAAGTFRALRGMGRDDAAIQHLSQWLETHRNDEIQTTLALAYADTGRLDEAIRLQMDTLSRAPRNVSVLNNLALFNLDAGDSEAALDYASQARALAPDLPAVLDTVGWVMVNADRLNEGLSVLREAQARAGGNARVHYHTAVALQKLGRSQEARDELQAALQGTDAFPERPQAEDLLSELPAN